MTRTIILCCLPLLALLGPVLNAGAADPLAADISAAVATLERLGLPISTAAVRRAAVENLARAVDPHARLMTADEWSSFSRRRNGLATTVPILLSYTDDLPHVAAVLQPSPCESNCVPVVGDAVVAIEDQDGEYVSPAAAAGLFDGPTGITVHITLRHADGSSCECDLERTPLQHPSLAAAVRLEHDIAYMKLNGLYADSTDLIETELRGWAQAGVFGVVLDLRGADGTNIEAAVRIASLFAPAGSLLYAMRDHRNQDIDVRRAVGAGPLGLPLMVLVDADTSGAAELLAAVLRGSARGGMIIGEETAGDPCLREPIRLPWGEFLFVATRTLSMADATAYDGNQGVTPDIHTVTGPVAGKPAAETEKIKAEKINRWTRGDPTLRRALDVLLGLKALGIEKIVNSQDSLR